MQHQRPALKSADSATLTVIHVVKLRSLLWMKQPYHAECGNSAVQQKLAQTGKLSKYHTHFFTEAGRL
jgi:hypothetical protein